MLARILAVLLPTTLFGCSFIFVNAPPDEPEERTAQAAGECTSSNLWPIVDVVGVPASAGNALYFSQDETIDRPVRTALVATHIGWGLLFAASAVHGFTATNDCRKLRKEVESKPPGAWSPILR
jgi:hypothetical protein